MALPSKDDVITLDYSYRGQPFVNVEAKELTTTSLDYSHLGQPFVGQGGGGGSSFVSAWAARSTVTIQPGVAGA